MRRRKTADGQFYGRRCISLQSVHPTGESLASRSPFPICVHGRLLRGLWDGLHSVAAPAILECGGKRSATPLWLARPGVPAHSKRRRCCALPAHSKSPGCRLSCELLWKAVANCVARSKSENLFDLCLDRLLPFPTHIAQTGMQLRFLQVVNQ